MKKELASHTYPKEQLTLVQGFRDDRDGRAAGECDPQKKGFLHRGGMNLVRNGEADAFVSAGSSGAILVGGQVLVGRIKGVERPPFGALIPDRKGRVPAS